MMSETREWLWEFSKGKHICTNCIHTAGMTDNDLSMTTQDYNSCKLRYDPGNDSLETVDNGGGYWITKCKYYEFDENLDKVKCNNGDSGMTGIENEEEIFCDVISYLFDKLEGVKNPDAKALIKDAVNYIKNTGSTYYISYRPDTVMLMKEYWQFFTLIGECGNCRFHRNLCVKCIENENCCIWVFDTRFVSFLSGLPEEAINENVKKAGPLFLKMVNPVPDIVYLLRFYDKGCRLLPTAMAFRSEAFAREAAVEMVPEGCRYEIVSVEVSD